MADQMLDPVPATIGVQAFAETSTQVRVTPAGDRVVVTFGDDLSGIRLMGDATAVHLLIVEADRQLTLHRDSGSMGE